MNIVKQNDILWNVALPLCVGLLLYSLGTEIPSIVRNYVPDGLWAYAATSSILITWQRRPNRFWLAITLFLFVVFECLQYLQVLTGTGDVLDLLVYLFGYALSILFNSMVTKQNCYL